MTEINGIYGSGYYDNKNGMCMPHDDKPKAPAKPKPPVRSVPGSILFSLFGCSTQPDRPTDTDRIRDGATVIISPRDDAGGGLVLHPADAGVPDAEITDATVPPINCDACTEPPIEALLPQNQLVLVTGDRDQMMNIQTLTVYLAGGQGLKDLQLGMQVQSNTKLIDPNLPCVPDVVCVSKDGDGNYLLDPNDPGYRLPVSFVSYTLTDRHQSNPAATYTRDYSNRPVIGAVCDLETNGTPVVGDIPKGFNEQGDLDLAFAFNVSVDVSNALYNAQYDYRVEVALFKTDTAADASMTPNAMPLRFAVTGKVMPAPNNKLIDQDGNVIPLLDPKNRNKTANKKYTQHPDNKYTVIRGFEKLSPKAVEQ